MTPSIHVIVILIRLALRYIGTNNRRRPHKLGTPRLYDSLYIGASQLVVTITYMEGATNNGPNL